METERPGANAPRPEACEACEACAANAASETCEVASATECTGLMPALPENVAEDEARAALYAIHSAKKPGKGR